MACVGPPSLTRQVLIPPDFMRALNQPDFFVKNIKESSSVADQDTIISVELSPNFLLRAGSAVTITGLTGTQSEDSADFGVNIFGEGNRVGKWAQATGTFDNHPSADAFAIIGNCETELCAACSSSANKAPRAKGMYGGFCNAAGAKRLSAWGWKSRPSDKRVSGGIWKRGRTRKYALISGDKQHSAHERSRFHGFRTGWAA